MSKLEYRKGCLIEAFKSGEVDVIAHGVNCQGVMGSGVAKLIKQEFPVAFERYQTKLSVWSVESALGEAQTVFVKGYDDQYIFNLFTQVNYGTDKRHVNYAALVQAFDQMLCACGKRTIGIPKLGAGLGGGNWSIIEQLIEDTIKLVKFEGKVIVYEL